MKKIWVYMVLLLLSFCGSEERIRREAQAEQQNPLVENEDAVKYQDFSEKEKPLLGGESASRKKMAAEEKSGSDFVKSDTRTSEDRPVEKPRSEIKKSVPAESGLKAGFADDNKQFSYFLKFLEKYQPQVASYPLPVAERIIFKLKDQNQKSLPNAKIQIFQGKKELEQGKTLSDGSFYFFPSLYPDIKEFKAVMKWGGLSKELVFNREGKRIQEVVFNLSRPAFSQVPLDMVFVFDTTGSMGEEIARLKRTIEIIHLNLSAMASKPRVRFGLVLYRDREEEYLTKVVPLTEDLEAFADELSQVEADGGGDQPEDLQEALKDLTEKINWSPEGIRMAFMITDAPAHLDYGQAYTYVHSAKEAKKMGIRIFSIGTGGLPLAGEYVLRQIAQYTAGKYIFLTYGETTENEGGKPGSVSHHTGDNFQSDKLETIIMRFAKEELAHLVSEPLDPNEEEYFQAVSLSDEKKEETLQKLFDLAAAQLSDYSSLKLAEKTAASLLPMTVADPELKAQAEYFSEQLFMSLTRHPVFKMVERKDFQKILTELELQSSALFDEAKAVKLGNFLGAKVLILGKIYEKNKNFEIFLKAVRVETGEILSVTKVRIDRNLGLAER